MGHPAYCITLKGRALSAAMDCGFVRSGIFARRDLRAFEQFWEKLSPWLGQTQDQAPDVAGVISSQSNDSPQHGHQ